MCSTAGDRTQYLRTAYLTSEPLNRCMYLYRRQQASPNSGVTAIARQGTALVIKLFDMLASRGHGSYSGADH